MALQQDAEKAPAVIPGHTTRIGAGSAFPRVFDTR